MFVNEASAVHGMLSNTLCSCILAYQTRQRNWACPFETLDVEMNSVHWNTWKDWINECSFQSMAYSLTV